MHWIELARRENAAPDFELHTAQGDTVTRAQFRHRKHLVLIFLPHGDTEAFLDPFAARQADFEQASAVVYAVAPDASAPADSLPLLLDPGDRVRTTYAASLPPDDRPTPDQALLAIVDRYGVLSYLGVVRADEPGADEALSRVWGIEYECPE